MAYLSVQSPGKWISDIFGKYICSTLFDHLLDQQFSKKWNSEGSSEAVTQIRKGSYIDPLAMRCSPKSEFLIGKFNQNFSFFVKPYFLFLQYRKLVLKKSEIFGSFFWALCSFCTRQILCLHKTKNLLSVQDRKLRFSDLFLSPVPPVWTLILFFFGKKTISGK